MRWILKSEGACYSIDDLKRDKKTAWTGIRNFQARNFMIAGMRIGDLCLFYHSSGELNGVYGVAKVVSKSHLDPTQFDKKDEHFDQRSKKEKPLWHCVDVAFVSKFKQPIYLEVIKNDKKLEGILVAKRGQRLSIMPVSGRHFKHIIELSKLAKSCGS